MPETLTAPPPTTTQDTPPVAPISGDSFADFDKTFPDGLDNPDPTPSSPPPKTDDKLVEPSDPKPEPKPKAEPVEKPTPQPATEPDGEFAVPQAAKPSELRGFAFRMANKAKAERAKNAEYEARIKALESAPPKQLEDNSAMAQE